MPVFVDGMEIHRIAALVHAVVEICRCAMCRNEASTRDVILRALDMEKNTYVLEAQNRAAHKLVLKLTLDGLVTQVHLNLVKNARALPRGKPPEDLQFNFGALEKLLEAFSGMLEKVCVHRNRRRPPRPLRAHEQPQQRPRRAAVHDVHVADALPPIAPRADKRLGDLRRHLLAVVGPGDVVERECVEAERRVAASGVCARREERVDEGHEVREVREVEPFESRAHGQPRYGQRAREPDEDVPRRKPSVFIFCVWAEAVRVPLEPREERAGERVHDEVQPRRARKRRLERNLADVPPDAHVERYIARKREQLVRVLRALELELLEDGCADVLRPVAADERDVTEIPLELLLAATERRSREVGAGLDVELADDGLE